MVRLLKVVWVVRIKMLVGVPGKIMVVWVVRVV